MNEIIIGDQTYISSKKAAEITGYAKDYIGQLCREGRVEARLVGRNWYVREAAIRDHRFGPQEENKAYVVDIDSSRTGKPAWEATYKPENGPTMPSLPENKEDTREEVSASPEDMQAAWQDWFKSNKVNEEPETVVLHKIEEVSEFKETPFEEEVSIPINRYIPEINPIEVPEKPPSSLQIYAENRAPVAFEAPPARSSIGMRALLISAGFLCTLITLLNLGYISWPWGSATASIVQSITGTHTYSK